MQVLITTKSPPKRAVRRHHRRVRGVVAPVADGLERGGHARSTSARTHADRRHPASVRACRRRARARRLVSPLSARTRWPPITRRQTSAAPASSAFGASVRSAWMEGSCRGFPEGGLGVHVIEHRWRGPYATSTPTTRWVHDGRDTVWSIFIHATRRFECLAGPSSFSPSLLVCPRNTTHSLRPTPCTPPLAAQKPHVHTEHGVERPDPSTG